MKATQKCKSNPQPSVDLFDEEDDTETRPPNRPDIVLNPNTYEDYHHFRLPLAQSRQSQEDRLTLLRSDPATELLLFPVLKLTTTIPHFIQLPLFNYQLRPKVDLLLNRLTRL